MTDEKLKVIADTVAGAKLVPKPEPEPENPPPTDDDDPGATPPDAVDPHTAEGLPEDCPVIPLGVKGQICYYLNPRHELIALAADKHSQTNLPMLFAPFNSYLEEKWPRRTAIKTKVGAEWREEWITVGVDIRTCFNALMRACALKGVWKSMERIRGAGGWEDESGRLIFHCGDILWSLDAHGNPLTSKPGARGNYVYIGDSAILRPHPEKQMAEKGAAFELLQVLQTWIYDRPSLDPLMVLGQMGCGLVGGAIEWRPQLFITGDTAMGKSTLLKVVRGVHGIGGMVRSADATEAGIASQLGQSCLPVFIDEIENEVDSRRGEDVLKLARRSSSGDYRLRATQNIETQASRQLSTFTFAAIIAPPMPSQDRRRMGMIRLNPFPPGAKEPVVTEKWLHEIGSRLKRRIADEWHRLPGLSHQFNVMLTEAGHTSSTLKQYSSMMAMAWLMLHDGEVDDLTLGSYAAIFKADTFRETSDTRSNAQTCLDELVQAQPDVFKGGVKKSIAQIVREAVDFVNLPANKDNEKVTFAPSKGDDAELAGLKSALAATALALIRQRDGAVYLAVPNAHKLIAQIYQHSDWKARAGTTGGWAEALGRLPGSLHNRTARIGGRATKCCLVPLEHVLPADDVDSMDEKASDKRREIDERLKDF